MHPYSQVLRRLRWEDCFSPEVEATVSHDHTTPAWVTEQEPISKKPKKTEVSIVDVKNQRQLNTTYAYLKVSDRKSNELVLILNRCD